MLYENPPLEYKAWPVAVIKTQLNQICLAGHWKPSDIEALTFYSVKHVVLADANKTPVDL